MQAIYFDMDGTIYDLYGVRDWLHRLHMEDATTYNEGASLVDMNDLNSMMENLKAQGITVGVITWTAKGGSQAYNAKVRKVKREWVKKHFPAVTEFHCVKYGTPKHKVRRFPDSILVDDNADVRKAWSGRTIDAKDSAKMMQALRKLL